MKKWYLFEEVNGDWFETELKAEDQASAALEADEYWQSLTKHDRNRRTAFFIGAAEKDEDGIINYNNITDSVELLSMMREMFDEEEF